MDKPRADTPVAVRLAAMNLLSRREHSTEELRRKLLARRHPWPAVEEVLTGLQRDGLLSDLRFVKEYTRARAERGYGPVRIHAELLHRGVEEEQIEACLAAHDAFWVASIARVYRKQFGETVPSDFAERARRARFLHMRGFTAGQIRTVLNGIDLDY